MCKGLVAYIDRLTQNCLVREREPQLENAILSSQPLEVEILKGRTYSCLLQATLESVS